MSRPMVSVWIEVAEQHQLNNVREFASYQAGSVFCWAPIMYSGKRRPILPEKKISHQ